MRRQIKKQAPVFVAILILLVMALGIGGYILSNQRFYLPAWVPVLGTDFYTVEAELPTGQAVVPGQGQTVNIAGVKIGEVGEVTLEDGKAVVEMQIKDEYRPLYKDATILLRPKTGLKDMYLAVDPGTKGAGEIAEGGRVPVANTLPDVNADEVLAQLDDDTRAYLRVLLNAGGAGLRRRGHGRLGALRAERRAGPARDLQALRADGARRQAAHAAAGRAGARTSSGSCTTSRSSRPRSPGATGSWRRWWTRRTPTSRPSPRRRRRCARRSSSSPARSTRRSRRS